ncbi:hypothetical protein KIF53_16525 [Chromobacterium subtsugae]|uniref:Band 7 domain-containing protein n=1 Tax=Chromobacterium subtsugae TaxID=251747 RepID=A0ABS7FID2_9NEIS|nr:hypothetical protein [Chromobacterium subtsugae]MBW8289240.1 hypothetical protein [Chromobacterium subtsugae]
MANTWQKCVVLRAGKLRGVSGPGLFLIIPVVDNVVATIDERIQTTTFNAEQALTRDTVPVNLDAIIFWHVHDTQKAALAITDYRQAIDRVAQTSLRRNDRLVDAGRAAERPPQHRPGTVPQGRRKDDGMGHYGALSGKPRRRHTSGAAGLDVASGAGRTRKAGPHHLGVRRSRNRQQVRRGGQCLCRPPGRAAIAGNEHHLRNHQGARHHHSDPEHHCGQPESNGRRWHKPRLQATGHAPRLRQPRQPGRIHRIEIKSGI